MKTGLLAALCVLFVLILVAAYSTPAHANVKDRIMREARSYAGAPYGKGPNGLTCSEYTRLVYGPTTGVWMPSWDDKQRFYGFHPKHLERADLVFFDEYPHDGDPISHVAVYASDGWVWQSSSYWGMVVKTRMKYITDSRGQPAFEPQYTQRIR